VYDFLLVYNCHVWYIFHYIGIRKVCVVKYLAAVFVTSLCTLSALLHIVQVNLSSWATCTDVRHKPSCFSVTTSSDVYRAVWSSYQKNSAEEFLQSDSEVSDYITIGDVSLGKLLFFLNFILIFYFQFDFLVNCHASAPSIHCHSFLLLNDRLVTNEIGLANFVRFFVQCFARVHLVTGRASHQEGFFFRRPMEDLA